MLVRFRSRFQCEDSYESRQKGMCLLVTDEGVGYQQEVFDGCDLNY